MKAFLYALFFLNVFLGNIQANSLDSLLSLAKSESVMVVKSAQVGNFKKAISEKVAKEQFEEVVAIGEEYLTWCKETKFYHHHPEIMVNIGYAHERLNNYTDALACYSLIKADAQIDDTNTFKIQSISQTANIHTSLGNYDKAYDLQLQAMHAFSKNKDEMGIARTYYQLGTLAFYQKRFQEALSHYITAKEGFLKLEVPSYVFSSLGAVGSTYQELGRIDESLTVNKDALEIARNLKMKSGIAYTLANIGEAYLSKGNCKDALQAVEKSLELKKELKDEWGVIGSKMNLVHIFQKCGQLHKVESLLLEVEKASIALGSKNRKLAAYEGLMQYYEESGNIEDAYAYSKKYLALKDTILNEKRLEEMGQSKRRYELDKKEHQISLLKSENQLLNISKENQKLQLYIYIVALLLLGISIFWFVARLRMQRKMNHTLEEKNKLLFSKNTEIDIKNKQLEHSNQDLQQFAYVASHDLKEPLRMIHAYTNLLERKYDHLFDENGKEFMHYIVDAAERMKNLLDDLLDYSRSGTQTIPDKWVDVADVMIIVESNLRHRLNENKGTLIIKEQNLPAIKAHSTQLIQLFQNLVSNGLKFKGETDPVVIVDCQKEENRYVFSVKDNGIGISSFNKDKVFEMFRRLHTREEYEGTGIGLATCKRIVSNMGGDIWLDSQEGKGSTFFFTIPCPKVSSEKDKTKELSFR